VKEHPNLKPTSDGGFFHQFGNVFNFKKLKGIANGKELLFACLTVTMFFIPFNFYFTHMGNWMIYDLGFTAGNMGLVEGIALLAAVLCTLPFSVLINKNKIPFVALLGVISNALGLLLIFLLVKDKNSVDGANLLSLKNLPAIGCVFLIGLGYVLIMETTMIWMKTLFPKEALGQFEGVRILFFVLIPMFLGTIIGNIVIKNTPQPLIDGKPLVDAYGVPIDVPQENMFLYASILSVLTLVPLFFGWRLYKKRYGAKVELPQEEPPKAEE
jgi:MFS family permease